MSPADLDGGGSERRAVLVPTDARSVPPQLRLINMSTLGFLGISGLNYQVYFSQNLVDWTEWSEEIGGRDTMIEIDIPDGLDPLFLRVGIENVPSQVWSALQIKTEAELSDPLGGGEGEQHPLSFVRSVSHPHFLYAGIDIGGVWRSQDHGISWKKTLDNGAYAKGYPGLEVDPENPLTLYSFTEITAGDGSGMRDALEPYEGIYKSTDGGDNWSQVVAIPNPFTTDYANYRIWRQLFKAVAVGSTTEWYAVIDQSGIWQIIDPNDGSEPLVSQMASTPEIDIYFWVDRYETADAAWLIYGNVNGLFRRQIMDEGLGNEESLNVPIGKSPPNSNYYGGVTHIYVNPTDPDEIWAARRWDRIYRTLNGTSVDPIWVPVEILNSDGLAEPGLTWDSLGDATGSMVMSLTPFADAGHTMEVIDGGLTRRVPTRGFVSTRGQVFHLIWQGSTPYWQMYDSRDKFNNDFAKRPVLTTYRNAILKAHAGYRFDPENPDNIAAYGLSTFWHTQSGGVPSDSIATWRQTGYGHTGFAVQIGIGGIVVRDSNPDEKWFPWNDVGVGRTLDNGQSFLPLATIDAQKDNPRPDQFYWRTSANLHVHPTNTDLAVAYLGFPTGSKFKVGRTLDGGATWTVASDDETHLFSPGSIGGGAYLRVADSEGQLQSRAYLGRLYAGNSANTIWHFLDTFQDRREGDYEHPIAGRKHAVLAVSAGDGKLNPDHPTAYASRTDGYTDLIRGEPNPAKTSGFHWWVVMDDSRHAFKHTAGYPLVAVSPASRDIVFTAMRAASMDDATGTEFGQLLARYDFSDAHNADNPAVLVSERFLPAQPGGNPYNIVNDLAADPYDDRVVYVVSAAYGLPFVFKATFDEEMQSVEIEDLTADLPRIGASTITYDPSDGGTLLISNLAGTWKRAL